MPRDLPQGATFAAASHTLRKKMEKSTEKMTARHWAALVGLTMAAFVFNTSEFVPIGLLTDIAADFGKTESETGLLISAYAWVVALMSLPLMILASRMEMRRLMLILTGAFAACQCASWLSGSYAMLMASRIGVACCHSIFWSIVSPMAVRIVPAGHKALALSTIVTGSAVAMILGLPLGRAIGLWIGWRMTFLSVGAFAALVLAFMALTLPKLPSRGKFSVHRLPALLGDKALLALYAFTLVWVVGYYTAYSYIEPFLGQVARMSEGDVTLTLMLFGVAGIAAGQIFSRLYGRGPLRFIGFMAVMMTACLFLLLPVAASCAAVVGVCVLWGIGTTCCNVALQSELIAMTPTDSTAVAMSIYSGIFNLGIGTGAAVGGAVCASSSVGYVGVAGGACSVVALGVWAWVLLPRLRKEKGA